MGNPNRRREKKRKTKQSKTSRKEHLLPYTGKKYKTAELAQTHFRAELGIYESFVMTDRQLTDRQVRTALEKLILRMRKAPLAPLEDTQCVDHIPGQEDELVIWSVRRNWRNLFAKAPRPSRDILIGVLRTILGTVERWRSANPASRAYLRYIEGFLVEKIGVSVEKRSPDSNPMSKLEEDDFS